MGTPLRLDGGELLGDLGIVLGPVGFEEGDVVLGELVLDLGGPEDEALVDLAAEAPGGGEVDEDGMAGGAGLIERLLRVGLPRRGWCPWAGRAGWRGAMAAMRMAAMALAQRAGHLPRTHPAMASMRKQSEE